jgi:hypothetical protein
VISGGWFPTGQLNARSRYFQASAKRFAVSVCASPSHKTKIWRGRVNQAFS